MPTHSSIGMIRWFTATESIERLDNVVLRELDGRELCRYIAPGTPPLTQEVTVYFLRDSRGTDGNPLVSSGIAEEAHLAETVWSLWNLGILE